MKIWKAVLFLAFPCLSWTQSHWEAGAAAGYINYLGDMVEPVFTFDEAHLGAQLNLRHHFDLKHAIRLNFLYGELSGNDANYESIAARGVAFKSTLYEFTIIGEIEFFGDKRFSREYGFKKLFSPYLLAGAGVGFAEPAMTYSNPDNRDATVDYNNFHIVVPIGAGLKIDLTQQLYLGLEYTARFTSSDYLDGVQRSGNAYKNDIYLFGGLTAGYRLIR